MELGKRLKQARLDLGLSQRQLCGDAITRNMLSQIENGSARPSMDTLRYLAARLGKPVSFFLDEQTVTSPNQSRMTAARAAYRAGSYQDVLTALEGYTGHDPLFDEEAALLRCLARIALAEQALDQGRKPYAASLLEQAGRESSLYITAELERRRCLLLIRATGAPVPLPSMDEELLIRAQAALDGNDPGRCAALLDSIEIRSGCQWNLLRGRTFLAEGAWQAAADCLHRAEDTFPAATAPLLEHCYRELEDYKRAYEYACKQK